MVCPYDSDRASAFFVPLRIYPSDTEELPVVAHRITADQAGTVIVQLDNDVVFDVGEMTSGSSFCGAVKKIMATGTTVPHFTIYVSVAVRDAYLAGEPEPPLDGGPNPVMVRDINEGPVGTNPAGLSNVSGTLFFYAAVAPRGLWRSDGTSEGTVQVHPVYAAYFTAGVGSTCFFNAPSGTDNGALWRSDGTEPGTVVVRESEVVSSNTRYGVNVNGTLFFAAVSDSYVYGLWRSDGTEVGTTEIVVADLSYAYPGVNVNGTLFFTAHNAADSDNPDLWRSDGTAMGTTPFGLADFGVRSRYEMANMNGTLFFIAHDNEAAEDQLWRSDGTVLGTVVVKTGFAGYASEPANMDGTLFFRASTGISAFVRLWRSDGTEGGTSEVSDEVSMGTSNLENCNGTLFLGAQIPAVVASELFQSDGTEVGTVLIKDINETPDVGNEPLTNPSIPSDLTNVNGTLFFAATDGLAGFELWKFDPSLPVV